MQNKFNKGRDLSCKLKLDIQCFICRTFLLACLGYERINSELTIESYGVKNVCLVKISLKEFRLIVSTLHLWYMHEQPWLPICKLEISWLAIFESLNRSSKCVNLRYHKKPVFLYLIINSQSKLKKIIHTILETFTKKNSLWNLTRFHGGIFELEILKSWS